MDDMKSDNDSSDDDIWSYSPLARVPKTSKIGDNKATTSETVDAAVSVLGPKRTKCDALERKTTKVLRRRSGIHTKSSTSLRSKKTKGEKGGSDTVSPVKRVVKQQGYCPFCQMPFSILVVQSATWHISDCLREPLDDLQECPEGLQCDSTIQSHYHKLRHMTLALMRSGVTVTEGQQSGPTKVTDYDAETRGPHPAGMPPELPRAHPHELPDKLPHEPPEVTQSHDLPGLRTDAIFDPHEPESLWNPVDTPGSLTQDLTSEVGQRSTGSECKFAHTRGQSKRVNKDLLGTRSVDCQKTETEFAMSSDGNISDEVNWELSDLPDDASLEDDIASEAEVPSVCTDVLYNDGVTTAMMEDVNTWVPTDPMSSDLSQPDTTDRESDFNNTHKSPVLRPPAPLHHGNESLPKASTQSKSHSGRKSSQSPRKPEAESASRNQKSIQTFFKPLKSVTASSLADASESCVATHEVVQKPSNCANSKYPPWKSPCVVGRIVTSGVGDSRTVDSAKAPTWGYGSNTGRPTKKCPSYKWIPGTAFTVDAFSYGVIPGCAAYFLSHFHADHYMGLRKSFAQPIYCSQVTANLVRKKIGVDMRYLHALSLGTILDLGGTKVTFIEANHCPGSVLILFQMQNGQTILHTGDFRANSAMERHLVGIQVNQLFLDTTYCDPSYTFPPQHEVIALAVRMAVEYVQENPCGLIVVGAYTIGKERLFLAIAEAVNCHICVTSDKKAVLMCLDDSAITKRLTSKFQEAKVHVLPMSKLNYHGLCDYLESVASVFESIMAFQPTGWTHNKTNTALRDLKPMFRRPNLTLYGLPYSEHSSYSEMKRFVQFLAPTRIIPTVNNGNPTSRNKMEKLFHSWRTETREDPPSTGSKLTQSGLGNWLK